MNTYYGTKVNSKELISFLLHSLQANERNEAIDHRKTPVCIWGDHGIGKTEIVETLAKEGGYQWAYIAPAQFEEMGDLIGMPRIEENQTEGNSTTKFVAPDWVPRGDGPGILLIDDVNRADDRILRGIMQLLQNYELVSWKLPPKWHIILTANPDGGDYSVTPMDFAMITRMMHITLIFEVKAWAFWAEKNGIDARGIDFVLTYPECITGRRTTPRSLVQFFESIAPIEDLHAQLPLVRMLADSTLDQETSASFIAFVQQNLSRLVTPAEILGTDNFQDQILPRIHELVNQEVKRLDILSVLCTRLVNYAIVNEVAVVGKELENIKAFILMDILPNDLRLTLAQDLVNSSNPSLKAILAVPEIGKLLLQRM